MQNILFVKTSSLGDIVHQMPAMSDVRCRFPKARLTWIVEDEFASLARLHPDVNEVVAVSTRRWRSRILQRATWKEFLAFRTAVHVIHPEIVIDTQGLIRSALIARMVDGEHHGYDRSSIREPIASLFYDVTHSVARDLHAVTRNRLLTGLSLGYQPDEAIDYGLVPPTPKQGPPYVLLLHGTSRVTKEWREADWIGIGKWLCRQGFDVVLPWGSECERQRCVRLADAISGSRILERQPLDMMAQVIAGASFVIGVDTGLLHLAAAYGVPLIAIFLTTDPDLTGPVGRGRITILGGKGIYPSFTEVIGVLEQQLLPAAN